MISSWEQIEEQLGLSKRIELDIHPHHPDERADLFHSKDNSGSTEFEFLNLIHAFVLATKPAIALETGTFTGMGTVAIAKALNWNGFGKLTTVDVEKCQEARDCIERTGLSHHVEFVQSDSLKYCSEYDGKPFNLVFIDSGAERLAETNMLIKREKLAPSAVIILHDASPLREVDVTWFHRFEKECPLKSYTIKLSRGLRIMFNE